LPTVNRPWRSQQPRMICDTSAQQSLAKGKGKNKKCHNATAMQACYNLQVNWCQAFKTERKTYRFNATHVSTSNFMTCFRNNVSAKSNPSRCRTTRLRWSFSTVAHKCTPNLNHSHRNQITHTEFKLLTPNSNHSHRIQITHTEFKSITPNSNHSHWIQISHTEFKFKSLTLNLKYSHRIRITHTEIKSLTPKSNHSH